MALLKDTYSADYIDQMSSILLDHHSNFQKAKLEQVKPLLEKLEMKARVQHIADAIYAGFKNCAQQTISHILIKSAQSSLLHNSPERFNLWPILSVYERHFIQDFKIATQAFYQLTSLFTAEFSMRPFINQYPTESLKLCYHWAQDTNEHVRRLASEAIRPNLPWGFKIPYLHQHPQQIINILTLLQNDDSLYVRRSVANNLNDISKDHPDLVIDILSRWKKENDNPQCRWIIKHALRSLIKHGDKRALSLIGISLDANILIDYFNLDKQEISLGDHIQLSLHLHNKQKTPSHIMLDYIVHHVKSNGKTSPKTFKWKHFSLKENQSITLTKNHKIYPITTRKYYSGNHQIDIMINGQIMAKNHFYLNM